MKSPKLLIVDAIINLALGFLLVTFPQRVIQLLGVPMVERSFYPSILGGVLVGIGIALFIECFRGSEGLVGLGLGGAIAINLCAAFILAIWLVFGKINIPFRGQFFLWVLVAILVAISGIELVVHLKKRNHNVK